MTTCSMMTIVSSSVIIIMSQNCYWHYPALFQTWEEFASTTKTTLKHLVFGKLAKWVMKHWKCWNKKGPNSINVVFGLKRGVTDQDKSIEGEINILLWQDNVCKGRKSFQQQLSDSGTPQGSIFSPIPFSLDPFFFLSLLILHSQLQGQLLLMVRIQN